MKSRCIYLIILLTLTYSPQAQANSIKTLKYMLKARDQEPRMYLPDSAMLGNKIDILVLAPGAKKITLYGANEQGKFNYADEGIQLDEGAKVIGSQEFHGTENYRANFQIPLDLEKDAELADKFYYFEAEVSYEGMDGEDIVRRASLYGSNANFSNNNAVKILPIPEDYSGAANIARSMIPGLGQLGSTGY